MIPHETGSRVGPRIAFHEKRPTYAAMLDPVRLALEGEAQCLASPDISEIGSWRPDVLVAAAKGFESIRKIWPSASVVFTRHGFADKGVLESVVRASDYVCVSSEWVRDDLESRGITPRTAFWVTGFPAMDACLQNDTPPEGIWPEGCGRNGRVVLFAPTWSPGINAVEALGFGWIEALVDRDPSVEVLVKPHAAIQSKRPDWIAVWRDLAAKRKGLVHLIEDADASIFPLFRRVDMLVTDISSVMFYFLAMDRPIVLVTPPVRPGMRHYAPWGPEWQWRDMGLEVRSGSALVEAVLRCLQAPGEKAERRAFYRDRVFGQLTDGRSAGRIASRVLSLCGRGPIKAGEA